MTGDAVVRSIEEDRVDEGWLCLSTETSLEDAKDSGEWIGVREVILMEVRP